MTDLTLRGDNKQILYDRHQTSGKDHWTRTTEIYSAVVGKQLLWKEGLQVSEWSSLSKENKYWFM